MPKKRLYPFEGGGEISHSLTIIGVGGASANEIRKCTDLCLPSMFEIMFHPQPVIIEGLTITRHHGFPLGTSGVRALGVSDVIIRNCTFFDLNGWGVEVATQGIVRVENNLFLDGTGLRVCEGGGSITGNTFAGSV